MELRVPISKLPNFVSSFPSDFNHFVFEQWEQQEQSKQPVTGQRVDIAGMICK